MKVQLSGMSETWWTERHNSLMKFMVELPKIVEALEIISERAKCITAAKETSLLTAFTSFDLIVTIYILSNISKLILPLSRLFHKKGWNIASAVSRVKGLFTELNVKRWKSETK